MDSENSNGLGNLADELAEAFEEEEEGEPGEEVQEIYYDDAKVNGEGGQPASQGLNISMSPPANHRRNMSPNPPKHLTHSNHHHKPSKASQYDDSDYGDDSDSETTSGISPSLEARMSAIESLARRGTEAKSIPNDDIIARVSSHLKDLSSQAAVEIGTSRLITAHTALTTHLTNQTRTLQTLCHPFLSPLSAPLDPETIDALLPLLTSLIVDIPKPNPQPLTSLHHLHASMTDLTSILTYLSDTLHMTRQTTSLASRRLRATREMVGEMRKEAEMREEGEMWVERGGWNERLKGRECARICGDVVGGFEELCQGWRARLVGGVGVAA